MLISLKIVQYVVIFSLWFLLKMEAPRFAGANPDSEMKKPRMSFLLLGRLPSVVLLFISFGSGGVRR
jgi:hypothetical protein